MLSEHLLIPSRNLPHEMIITCLLKHLKVDFSGEKAIAISVDINSTLLKRMQTGTRVYAPSLLSSPKYHLLLGLSHLQQIHTLLL